MWRSSLRLHAALGLRRTLGETSAPYQSGHASQFRPKPKRKMSTMVKATPCCRLTKDSRRRQPDSAALIARLDRRHALHTSDVDEPLQESGGARGVNSRDCDAGDAFSARWTSEPTRPIQESDCQQSSTADEIVGHAAFGWQTHLRAIPVRQRGHVDVWAATKTPATRAFSARMDPVAEHRGRAARDPLARRIHDSGTADRRACAPDQVRRADARAGHQSDSDVYPDKQVRIAKTFRAGRSGQRDLQRSDGSQPRPSPLLPPQYEVEILHQDSLALVESRIERDSDVPRDRHAE